MIQLEPSACFLMAAWFLMLPLDWLLAALLAAAVHELGHLAAVYALGERVEFLSIGGFGARIHTGPLENRAEFLCAAAGPAASLFLLCLCRFFPKTALCGLVQGMFNLIPVYPMDGGRMLLCILRRLCPRRADVIFRAIQYLILCVLLLLSLLWMVRRQDGFLPILVCVTVLFRLLLSKIPCKSA